MRPGLLGIWGCNSRCWKFPVDTAVLLESIYWILCHMVSIVNDSKWCLALSWVVVIESAQTIDETCYGLLNMENGI